MKIQVDIISQYPPPFYTINIEKYGSGIVTKFPDKPLYGTGEPVVITAIPTGGYNFITWRKHSISTNPLLNLVVTSNVNLVARFKNPQTKRILITDVNPVHMLQVKAAFMQGYLESFGSAYAGTIEDRIMSDIKESLIYADEIGAEVVIRSTSGFDVINSQKYYPTLSIMPVGSNTHSQLFDSGGNLPAVLLTGEGTVLNNTAYDIETFATDPFGGGASSFSNPYIAGVLVAAVDSSFNNAGFKDYAAARYYLRKGKVWNNENGFGYLDYTELTDPANVNEYLANVAIDPDHYKKLDEYLLK